MKKNKGDEPIWPIVHVQMEVSQGNSLCSYLKQANMLFFFFYKIRDQEGRTGLIWVVGTSGRGRRWRRVVGE
jgi:hypothetical protein